MTRRLRPSTPGRSLPTRASALTRTKDSPREERRALDSFVGAAAYPIGCRPSACSIRLDRCTRSLEAFLNPVKADQATRGRFIVRRVSATRCWPSSHVSSRLAVVPIWVDIVNAPVMSVGDKRLTGSASCVTATVRRHMLVGQSGNIDVSAIRPVFVLAPLNWLTSLWLYFRFPV